jgi:hypothetical protein
LGFVVLKNKSLDDSSECLVPLEFYVFKILITALPEINKAPWKEEAEPEIC